MPAISFTDKDLARGTIVEPAWYRVRIDNVGEQPSKDGGSINYPVEATIIRNEDSGDAKYAGIPIEWMFNSKAIGFAKGYLNALGVEPEAGKRYELSSTAGRELVVFIENSEYQGRLQNRVNHKYRPVVQ